MMSNRGRNPPQKRNTDMENIRDFYKATYPECPIGSRINHDATFEGLTDDVLAGDYYDYVGTIDSVARERIFKRLAEIRGVSYDVIYQTWLNGFKEANGVLYRRDWNCDGAIRMHNPKTVELYHKLRYEFSPEMHDCFFAFSEQQLKDGMAKFNLKREDLVNYGSGTGLIGTQDGITDYLKQYDEPERRIKEECNPQEVYFYEYNNHECMIAWDGDLDAIKIIIARWGVEVAKTIKRFNATRKVINIANDKKIWK